MNPLDKAELGNFDERIQKEMPFHSSNKAKIPLSFSQNMPKRIMEDLSVPTNNRFLNKHLHIIEEILHRDPNNKTAKEFLNYQNHYFGKYGILKGDGVFHKILNSKHKALARMGNIPSRFLIFSSHVNGANLFTATGGNDQGSYGNNIFQVYALKDLGNIGEFYDGVGMDVKSASGSLKLAVYNDSGGLPNNLKGSTSGFGSTVSYILVPIPEFALDTTQNWTAFNNTANGMHPATTNNVSGSDRRTVGEAFATSFTDPAPATTDQTNADIANMKIGHS